MRETTNAAVPSLATASLDQSLHQQQLKTATRGIRLLGDREAGGRGMLALEYPEGVLKFNLTFFSAVLRLRLPANAFLQQIRRSSQREREMERR